MPSIRTFYILTLTQVLSLIGSSMTSIAIGMHVFNATGDATPVLLAGVFAALPMMIGGSVAGVLVDRWERRRVLLLCDLGQAIGTLFLLAGFLSGGFQLWQLYTVAALQGLLGMLQRPALEASVALLMPPEHLDRANVVRQLAGPAAGVVAPALAGMLYALIGVVGVIVIDLLTFTVAIIVVARLTLPPTPGQRDTFNLAALWADYREGLSFLWQRRTLLVLMIYAAVLNFLLAGPISLSTPYLLSLTGNERLLGLLLGTMNIGMVVGGIAMAMWGGTRPRIHGIMIGLLIRSAWLMLYGVARTPLTLGLALFFVFFTNPLVDASFASLLQTKVPPAMQGRVFALLFQVMHLTNPLSLLIVGPLVDHVLEPAVTTSWWAWVAPMVGRVPGSGMGLLIVTAGALMFVLTALVYAHPATRCLEQVLPDHHSTTSAS